MNKLSFSAALVFAALFYQTALADDVTPSIHATGSGEVSAEPDRAFINVSVEARNHSLTEARGTVSSVVAKTLEVVDELKIDRRYVNSSGSRITPQYRYVDRKRVFDGYYVSRQITVDLRNLELIGQLTEKLVDAGINNVSPPRFGSTNAAALKREALKRASEDAKRNADAIATGLGITLGKVLNVNAHSNNHQPRPVLMEARMAADASAASEQTYETGQISYTANVNVRFAIQP